MLKFISWKQFIEVGVALVGSYYLGVLLMFYRKEIQTLLKRKKLDVAEENLVTGQSPESLLPALTKDNTPPEFLLTENIVFELKALVKKLVQDGVDGRDLLKVVAGLLQHHRELQHTPYGKAINKFIILEYQKSHSVHLDEREVMRLWGK